MKISDASFHPYAKIATSLPLRDIARLRAASKRTRFDLEELELLGDSIAFEGLTKKGSWLEVSHIVRDDAPNNDQTIERLHRHIELLQKTEPWQNIHKFIDKFPQGQYRRAAFAKLAQNADSEERSELLRRQDSGMGALLWSIPAADHAQRLAIARHSDAEDFILSELAQTLKTEPDDRLVRAEILKNPEIDGLTLDVLAKNAVDPDERRAILNHGKIHPYTISLLAQSSHDREERTAIRRHHHTGSLVLADLARSAVDPAERRAILNHGLIDDDGLAMLADNSRDPVERQAIMNREMAGEQTLITLASTSVNIPELMRILLHRNASTLAIEVVNRVLSARPPLQQP